MIEATAPAGTITQAFVAASRKRGRRGLLRRHVAETGTQIERLAALRDDLLAMLAAMPGPGCPDPLPGTWCPPGLPLPEGR